MTADKPQPPRSPTGSFSQAYTSAFVYPGTTSSAKSTHGPRTQSTDSTSPPKAVDPRDRPGSSRTKFTAPLPPIYTSPMTEQAPTRQPSVNATESGDRPQTPQQSSQETAVAPYRSPEPVYDPPSDDPPGYVPAVVEELYEGSDDDFQIKTPPAAGSSPIIERDKKFDVTRWQANVGQDHSYQGIEDQQPERPQIGPGLMPRSVEDRIHDHPLMRITHLRVPPRKAPVSQTSPSNPLSPKLTGSGDNTVPTTPDSAAAGLQPQQTGGSTHLEHIRTLQDVQESLPGGADGYMEWYYCWRCSAWYKVTLGTATIMDGEVKGSALDWDVPSSRDSTDLSAVFDPHRGRSRLLNIESSRLMPLVETHIHFHELRSSLTEPTAKTLERVDDGLEVNSFPHKELESEVSPSWYQRATPLRSCRLFACCSSSASVLVGAGPVGGQIPPDLMREFVYQKQSNPGPGVTTEKEAKEGVREAIQLLITLLGNPLFSGQRGWVKLDNKRFQRTIGNSIVSSLMLYMIGFGCRQEAAALRVGPLAPGVGITEAQVLQQDRYMMRAWVELNMFLVGYIKFNGLKPLPEQDSMLELTGFGPDIDDYTLARYLPIKTPINSFLNKHLRTLGVTQHDSISTILAAYDQQKACDAQNLPKYLGALEALSKALPRAEELSYKLAFDRSMGYYTDGDVDSAYATIGYTTEYAHAICVEPDEAPDDEILKMHREASQKAANHQDRQEISLALAVIGKHRKNAMMVRFAESGQSLMTVDEAYAALSAPKDSIDDGLIMQYEMAVNEYPGRAEHYKSCLEIIAKQDDVDRSALRRYLETGSQEVQVVQRNDIPVGLENIGNTCYLNSVLQFLYCIKPLRSAVMAFEQDKSVALPQVKPEVERAKEFVRHLRLLFLQLYKSETSAVRPDMELAYLAITVPQSDQVVHQEVKEEIPAPELSSSFLDSIPTVGSPSSTRVNSPEPSLPTSPIRQSASPSRSSILGKRASQDRESNGSPTDRPKRADTIPQDDGMSISDKADSEVPEDFEIISKPDDGPTHRASITSETVTVTPADQELSPSSPVPGHEMKSLKLKSPSMERSDPMVEESQVQPRYDPPPGPPPLPPRPQARSMSKAVLDKGLEFGKQQDSAEVLGNVLDQLESAFEPSLNEDGSKGTNFVTDLFSCMYRQQIVYHLPDGTQDAQAPVECRYSRPALNVMEEGKDLYDCLAELYLGGADIEYEGKKGHMMDLMDQFPPVLYIEMRRSQYEIDPVSGRAKAIKVNTHIPFAQTLAMDRFMVDVDGSRREASIEITRQSMALRARLHALRSQKPLPVKDTFTHLHKSLAHLKLLDPDLDITDDFLAAVEPEADRVQQEMDALETSIANLRQKLDTLWADQPAYEYELVSVFMHRGRTSGAGHYWTYQSDLPRDRDRFFKYNDEQVTEVPASEVLQDRTGSDANPALLCYVRKDKDLVETLHREVFELEHLQALQQETEQGNMIIEDKQDASEEDVATQTVQQQGQPATLDDVEMGGQGGQTPKPEPTSQLVDVEMTEPPATSTTATKLEKPLIDFGDDALPPQSEGRKEKEDDLMDQENVHT